MAITRNSLPDNFSFTPDTSLRKHATLSDFIIIDDPLNGQRNVSGNPVWIKITDEGAVDDLSEAPENLTEFLPDHSNWSTSRVYVKGNQVVLSRYPTDPVTDFSNASEVTEYTLGTGDVIFLKIDPDHDTVTAYKP